MSLPNNRGAKNKSIILVMKNNKHCFYSDICIEEMDVLKFPHAVSQSFLSVFPYLSVETMATAESAAPSTG
jgi:hypothetical protein